MVLGQEEPRLGPLGARFKSSSSLSWYHWSPQAWAEASGAYTPGKDKPDLPTWKRNFRSALNRKEALRLAEDHSKDPHDPHKIYEFVTSGVLK